MEQVFHEYVELMFSCHLMQTKPQAPPLFELGSFEFTNHGHMEGHLNKIEPNQLAMHDTTMAKNSYYPAAYNPLTTIQMDADVKQQRHEYSNDPDKVVSDDENENDCCTSSPTPGKRKAVEPVNIEAVREYNEQNPEQSNKEHILLTNSTEPNEAESNISQTDNGFNDGAGMPITEQSIDRYSSEIGSRSDGVNSASPSQPGSQKVAEPEAPQIYHETDNCYQQPSTGQNSDIDSKPDTDSLSPINQNSDETSDVFCGKPILASQLPIDMATGISNVSVQPNAEQNSNKDSTGNHCEPNSTNETNDDRSENFRGKSSASLRTDDENSIEPDAPQIDKDSFQNNQKPEADQIVPNMGQTDDSSSNEPDQKSDIDSNEKTSSSYPTNNDVPSDKSGENSSSPEDKHEADEDVSVPKDQEQLPNADKNIGPHQQNSDDNYDPSNEKTPSASSGGKYPEGEKATDPNMGQTDNSSSNEPDQMSNIDSNEKTSSSYPTNNDVPSDKSGENSSSSEDKHEADADDSAPKDLEQLPNTDKNIGPHQQNSDDNYDPSNEKTASSGDIALQSSVPQTDKGFTNESDEPTIEQTSVKEDENSTETEAPQTGEWICFTNEKPDDNEDRESNTTQGNKNEGRSSTNERNSEPPVSGEWVCFSHV